jgi:hypothetical protein
VKSVVTLVTALPRQLFLQVLHLSQHLLFGAISVAFNKKLKFKVDKMTTEEQFLQRLLADTKEKFLESPVLGEQQLCGRQWNYSACGTPIQVGKGILLGINWGVSGDHEPQTEMPDGKDIPTYNFIQRSRQFLEQHLHLDFDTKNFNYTNLCFFRTPREVFLRPKDYENSLPLFRKFVEFVKPEWIFSLSNNNTKILQQHGQLRFTIDYYDSESKHKGVKANLWGHPYFSVPHPNARVKAKSREEIWEQIGQQISLLK